MKIVYGAGLVVVAVAAYTAGRWRPEAAAATAGSRRILYYRDPMHPEYRSNKPGTAPDCGMDLEPVYAGGAASPAAPPGTVQVSAEKRQLMGVQTAEARWQSITRHLRMPGRVTADELRVYKVAVKSDGWVRQVYPVTTGTLVRKGQPLVTIYGKDYRMAQQSYIYALYALDKAEKDQHPTKDFADSREQTRLQVAEALSNLQNMWVDPEQVGEIERTRQAQFETRLAAPADGFILIRNVYLNQKLETGTELYRLVDL